MAGEYTRLVHAAQADPDPARRQQAMGHLAAIGPYAGNPGNEAADAMAAPVLARLYPAQPPLETDTSLPG